MRFRIGIDHQTLPLDYLTRLCQENCRNAGHQYDIVLVEKYRKLPIPVRQTTIHERARTIAVEMLSGGRCDIYIGIATGITISKDDIRTMRLRLDMMVALSPSYETLVSTCFNHEQVVEQVTSGKGETGYSMRGAETLLKRIVEKLREPTFAK